MRQHSTRSSRIRAERRLRRGGRGALAALAVAALGLSVGVAVLPAQAAVPAPKVRVIAGAGALTASWNRIAGATGYSVKVSEKQSLAHARTVRTTAASVKVGKLRNGHTYYVGVTPVGLTAATGGVATRSKVVHATAHRGVPLPVGKVTVSAGAEANQVKVEWTGGGKSLKVAVVAGSNVTTDERSFHSAWYPATTRSITLTVPAKYRAYLGAGSGNPVWAKVVQSNSSSTAFGPSYSYARKYRPSPVGSWAFARAVTPAAAVTKLRVAELNIQSVGATAGFSRTNQWAARAPRAAAYVDKAAPDLLTTAELATNVITDCHNHPNLGRPYACRTDTQVADFAKRVSGLKLAGTDAYDRVLDEMNSSDRWNGNVTDGAHVFYNPDKLTLLDHGYFSPALSPGVHFGNVTGLGVSNWTGKNAIGGDRWLSWAKFQTLDGRQFFAVAGHFPVGDAAVTVAARLEESHKLIPVIDAMAGDLPVVLGADMNSDAVRSPKAVQVPFLQDGWFDAAAVPAKKLRTGMKVSTANGSGEQIGAVDQGYGSRPVLHPYQTSRIDYILLRNSPHTYSYANVMYLHSDGTFIKSLQGTDHNMQLAEIGIGDPAPVS